MIQLTGSLPKVGGLLDQDSYHMHLIQTVAIVMEEKRKKEEQKKRGPQH